MTVELLENISQPNGLRIDSAVQHNDFVVDSHRYGKVDEAFGEGVERESGVVFVLHEALCKKSVLLTRLVALVVSPR